MKSKTTKSLQVALIITSLLIVTSSFQLFIGIIEHNPTWLYILQALPIPIFLVLFSVICLDLFKKDIVTINGKLIEMRESGKTRKAYLIRILTESGKIKKFRFNKIFSDIYSGLEIDQKLEVTFYKRTKAVTAINHLVF
jgi:hypothetical protein